MEGIFRLIACCIQGVLQEIYNARLTFDRTRFNETSTRMMPNRTWSGGKRSAQENWLLCACQAGFSAVDKMHNPGIDFMHGEDAVRYQASPSSTATSRLSSLIVEQATDTFLGSTRQAITTHEYARRSRSVPPALLLPFVFILVH